ncbi:MAG: CCA tRNA nucleotidyltransferase [Phycisphaerae bacterium]|nr:CCA tRNA nucleotidyltransferase [Phycisphaerae bacterium]
MDFIIKDRKLNDAVNKVCQLVNTAGGRAFLIGGCVRDFVLNMHSKDIDIEVYNLAPQKLIEILSEHFKIDLVGQSFGVIKIHDVDIDISIPRRESKSGLGHKGFEISSDPNMSPKEAASRRDFTINTIAYDFINKVIIDPFDGMEHLNKRILKHTTEKFLEDPLRVLRGMQFAARFDLNVAPETAKLCSKIKPEGLASERIFEEWKKLILHGIKPSKGLSFLRDCGWIDYFPELKSLIDCKQDLKCHPEGDVWEHTLHSMDAFAEERIGDAVEDLIVGFAVLCHDFGKPQTTIFQDSKICTQSYEAAGVEPTKCFIEHMTNRNDIVDAVIPLVESYMSPVELFNEQASDNAIRRLAKKVKRIDRLVRVSRADQLGRFPTKQKNFPAGDWLIDRACTLNVEMSAPDHIIMGRHLIELGLKPGIHFNEILQTCYDAQIDGEFFTLEDAKKYVITYLQKRNIS